MLDGVSIVNSPVTVTVSVSPDNTVLIMGIVFGVIIFAVGVFFWLYSKFGKRGINAGKEREVSVDVKLRKILDSKIHAQDTMTLIEVREPAQFSLPLPTSTRLLNNTFAQLLDILSDIFNSVFKLLIVLSPRLAEVSAVPAWINYLFIVLGVVAVPLGAYLITQRGRVRARAQTRC
jgi:cytochrome bd-type quinol oxidase subunit 2